MVNRKNFAGILMFFTLCFANYSFGQNWQHSWKEVISSAQKDHKKILLNFSGSDWCIPCIRMHKELFDSKEFIAYSNDSLELYNADFPRTKKNQPTKDILDQNYALADKYNHEGSFPLTLLLDSNGKILKKWIGFYSTGVDKFIAELH